MSGVGILSLIMLLTFTGFLIASFIRKTKKIGPVIGVIVCAILLYSSITETQNKPSYYSASASVKVSIYVPAYSAITTPSPSPENIIQTSLPSIQSSYTKDDTQSITVYVTKTGSKYHVDGCQYLSHSQIQMTLSDAMAAGYTPCSVCHPPKLDSSGTVNNNSSYSGSNSNTYSSNQLEEQEITVYITKTGEKYHRANCRYLKNSKIAISLSEAKAYGYGTCSVCDPPS